MARTTYHVPRITYHTWYEVELRSIRVCILDIPQLSTVSCQLGTPQSTLAEAKRWRLNMLMPSQDDAALSEFWSEMMSPIAYRQSSVASDLFTSIVIIASTPGQL